MQRLYIDSTNKLMRLSQGVEMGMLVRRRTETEYEWLIEI